MAAVKYKKRKGSKTASERQPIGSSMVVGCSGLKTNGARGRGKHRKCRNVADPGTQGDMIQSAWIVVHSFLD